MVHSTLATKNLLYYENSYLRETAGYLGDRGSDEKDRDFVIVSPTNFHPHGGGQKGDRGRLYLIESQQGASVSADSIEIADTRYSDDGIRHVFAEDVPDELKSELQPGSEVKLVLDWEFRQKQMRLHSAAHVLHIGIEQVLAMDVPFPRTSDLLEDSGLNRYEIPNLLDQEQFARALEWANRFAVADHPIHTSYDHSPGARPGARLWQCGEWTIPCGGTHPTSTAFIGEIRGQLSTRRGRTSITFSTVK